MKIKQISPLEHNFTKVLGNIAVMPKMLYYYGKLPEPGVADGNLAKISRPKVVAIVGARKNTAYGEDVAFRAAKELASRGVVVISGLAYGIDGIAHRGALAGGGVTVGVLGTPIDKIYPLRNIGLAKEMIERGGAIISEYASGTPMYAARFLERNRLVAGLADAVIVVEANVRSGSLNTAAHALEQGKELFAVPGDINRPLSEGCNQLLRQGAAPYTCVEDVLNVLFPAARKVPRQTKLFGDNPAETAILTVLGQGEREGARILMKTGMDAAEFGRTITMLEIKGRIRSLGMNRWTLR